MAHKMKTKAKGGKAAIMGKKRGGFDKTICGGKYSRKRASK